MKTYVQKFLCLDILCVFGLYFICSKTDCVTSVRFIVSGKTRFIAMFGRKSESKILLPTVYFSTYILSVTKELCLESICDTDRSVYSKINQVTTR